MELREQIESTGDWLFLWRSYLPFLFFGPLAAVVPQAQWMTAAGPHLAAWDIVCLAVAVLGLCVRILVAGYAPARTSGRNTRRQRACVLNTSGMYSLVRHPLYLGNFLIGLAWTLYPRNGWMVLVYILLFWLYYERIMLREESFLRAQFGPAFIDWSAATPAFLPRTLHWSPPLLRFSLRTVIRREYLTATLAIAMFILLRAVHHLYRGVWQYEPFWAAIGGLDVALFVAIRAISKRTRWLRAPGR